MSDGKIPLPWLTEIVKKASNILFYKDNISLSISFTGIGLSLRTVVDLERLTPEDIEALAPEVALTKCQVAGGGAVGSAKVIKSER